jgi:hypothetical protein
MPTTLKYRVAFEAEAETNKSVLDQLIEITRDPDLLAISLFCLLGLLATLYFVHFLPLSADLAATFAQTG